MPLTYFEFGTLAAIQAFAAAGVDAWLLEVGMGGRLDAVNAVEPDGCVITSIGLDHCAWLGDDIESIAREKAGVMRPAKPVVFGSSDVPTSIRDHATAIDAQLLLAGEDFDHEVQADDSWRWRGSRHTLPHLALPGISGSVQLANASAALALLEALGRDDALSVDTVSDAMRSISLNGRFQTIGKHWILDVAHNPAAAEVLSAQLAELGVQGRLTAIVGMLMDKDVEGFAQALDPSVDAWIAVPAGAARSAAPDLLAQRIAGATGKPCLVSDSLERALEHADSRASEGDRTLVTGSFYVVGPALESLRAD